MSCLSSECLPSPPAISNAYSVLSDPDKRKQYDMYGEEGLRQSSGGHTHYYADFDQFDLFRQMFNDDFFADSKHHCKIRLFSIIPSNFTNTKEQKQLRSKLFEAYTCLMYLISLCSMNTLFFPLLQRFSLVVRGKEVHVCTRFDHSIVPMMR